MILQGTKKAIFQLRSGSRYSKSGSSEQIKKYLKRNTKQQQPKTNKQAKPTKKKKTNNPPTKTINYQAKPVGQAKETLKERLGKRIIKTASRNI